MTGKTSSPSAKLTAVAVTKLRSASSSTGRNEGRIVTVWTRNIQSAQAATTASPIVSAEENQPFCCPRSSMSWNAARASARNRKPIRSSDRLCAG